MITTVIALLSNISDQINSNFLSFIPDGQYYIQEHPSYTGEYDGSIGRHQGRIVQSRIEVS